MMASMGFYITRDGSPVSGKVHGNEFSLLGEFHRITSVSMSHAIQHEGYGVSETEADVWSDENRDEHRATGRRMFSRAEHGHGDTFEDAEDEQLTRENCGACALEGFGARNESGFLAPSYGGWARIYVEAGRRIPEQWREAFAAELNDENRAYAEALARDIRTFGVSGADVPAWVLEA